LRCCSGNRNGSNPRCTRSTSVCEYLKSPLGIDRTSPRLSWKLQAALHGERGLRQTAFQFLVAATVDSLGAGNGDPRQQIKRATVYLSGLGFFDLSINGAKLGDYIMDPALTEYSKRMLYLTFDVTDHLNRGENALGVILGNGRFFAPRGSGRPVKFKTYGYPKLLLQLEIEYADGRRSNREG
jgi:hypothetical protein